MVATTDTRELRRRLLPARLVVYFVLALWLFRGPNCGYGRVMVKLVDALYHRRRGQQLLEGVLDPDGWVDAGAGRRWRPPNISSLARPGPGWGPIRCTCCSTRSPARSAPRTRRGSSAAGCGWCPWTAPPLTCPTRRRTTSTSAAVECPPSRGVPAVPVAGRGGVGTGALIGATIGPYTVGEQTLARDLLPAFRAGMLVLADRNFLCHTLVRDVLATGSHILWRPSASFRLTPIRVLADGNYLAQLHPRRKADGPPITVRVIEYTVHTSRSDSTDAAAEDSSEVFALVTDLLDIEAYPALDLACPTRCGGSARP